MKQTDLVAALILSATLSVAIVISAGALSPVAILVTTFTIFFCLALGRALINVLHVQLPPACRFPAEILAGVALVSSMMLLLCLLLKTSAAVAFAIAVVPSAGLMWLNAVRASPKPQEERSALVLTSLVCASSLIWSWQAIRSVPRLRSEGMFTAWNDFFYHSCMIIQFAKTSGSDVFEQGAHLPLYHYASYMLSALIFSTSSTPAMVVATAHWCLLGFILMGLGAWMLGAVLADQPGSFVAVCFVLLMPNASHYLMKNAFFDFQWLLQISPALSYGLGLASLVLGLSIVALRLNSFMTLGLAIGLAFLEALFKIQLFVLLLPSCCIAFVWFWPGKTTVKAAISVTLLAAAVVGAAIAETIDRAPHFWTGQHLAVQILTLMLDGMPSAIVNPFARASAALPPLLTIPVGLAILMVSAFGLLLPAYLLGVYYRGKRKKVQAEDLIPLILIAVYCLIVAVFPASSFNESREEYQHRNFVLIYVVLSVWCGVFLLGLVERWLNGRQLQYALLALFCVTFPVSLLLSPASQTGTMAWTQSFARTPISAGFLESAKYIRDNAKGAESVFENNGVNEDALIALSEHPAVLAFIRGVFYSQAVKAQRKAIVDQLQQARTYEQLTEAGHNRSVNWYVVAPGTSLPSDVASRAELSANGYYVFHFR